MVAILLATSSAGLRRLGRCLLASLGPIDQRLAIPRCHRLQRIQLDAFVQAGADDGVEVGAESVGTSEVLVRASAVIARDALRVGGELDLAAATQTDRNPVSLRVQDFPQLLAASDQPFFFFSAECFAISSRTCIA